jgi:hypothetical protein
MGEMNQDLYGQFVPYLLLSPYPLAFGFLLCAFASLRLCVLIPPSSKPNGVAPIWLGKNLNGRGDEGQSYFPSLRPCVPCAFALIPIR